jgi:PAS domain S-box-containing protein
MKRAQKTRVIDASQARKLRDDVELILESAGEGIYGVDAEGRTTFMNPAAIQLLGLGDDHVLGTVQHEISHHSRPDGSPYPREACPIYAAFRDGKSRRVTDEVFWRADGTSFPVEYTSTPILEDGRVVGAVVMFRDVSYRREAEERDRQLLREQIARAESERQRQRLDDLFQQAPAAIAVVVGPDHVFETANPRYLDLLGSRDVLGKPVARAFPELVGQGLFELLDEVYRTGQPYVGTEVPARVQRDADTPPGQAWFNFVYQPLRDRADQVYGIMIHAVEVTEMVRARTEVERKAAELTRTSRLLERSNAELDQFAYVASHDLKAPLRGISNLSAWIEEDLEEALGADTARHMQLLRNRVQRMENLIDGVLAYSRAGRGTHASQEVDTGRLVADTVDLLSPGDRVTVEIAPDMPVLETAPVPLEQVFQNLIHNAIRHGGDAGTVVRVGWRDAGDAYEFSVADDGPGIAPEYQNKIWGIFQTLKARDELEGTGIGLSLVKKIVEARGGSVRVESTEGHGATFFFTWPRCEVQHGQ